MGPPAQPAQGRRAMKLYTYWRSTTAYRARIALNLKGVVCDHIQVDLVKDGGQQHAADYVALNPGRSVPTLVTDGGEVLTQSLAIIDWLDATYPDPPLVPSDPLRRARCLAIAHTVAMDIHPVNNLRVAQKLGTDFGADADAKADWMRHWMRRGFDALTALLPPDLPYATGDAPSLADICIVPQIYNANRWGVDMSAYPRLVAIERACLALKPFQDARPEGQPGAA